MERSAKPLAIDAANLMEEETMESARSENEPYKAQKIFSQSLQGPTAGRTENFIQAYEVSSNQRSAK